MRILSTLNSTLETFKARLRHPVLWPSPKERARESSRLAQQGILHGLAGHLAVLVQRPHFIGSPRPGLTPDNFTRGREVVEGAQGFQPQQWRRAKSKERPSSGDRSFEASDTLCTY